ncbi:Unknown protein, partial [Striga hermonthica]
SIIYSVPIVFLEAHHSFCCYHITKQMRPFGKSVLDIFYKAAYYYRRENFYRYLSSIQSLKPEAFKKLTSEIPVNTWARCFTPVRHYGFMTSNSCESLNNKLRWARMLPVCSEFTRLAAFVPDLVRTEAQRVQRFIDGLYPAVHHNIVGHGTQTYARAVSIAQEVDASIRRKAIRDRPQPSAPAQSSAAPPALPAAQPTKEKKRKGKGAQTDRRTRQRQQQVPQCPTCRRFHRGECRFGQDICYYCHEPGHFANRCPKKAQQPQQPQQPQQQQQP